MTILGCRVQGLYRGPIVLPVSGTITYSTRRPKMQTIVCYRPLAVWYHGFQTARDSTKEHPEGGLH